MAAIDDLLTSQVIADVTARLTAATAAGARVVVPFEALELGSESEFGTEAAVTDLIDALKTAKTWQAKVDFVGRVVILYV